MIRLSEKLSSILSEKQSNDLINIIITAAKHPSIANSYLTAPSVKCRDFRRNSALIGQRLDETGSEKFSNKNVIRKLQQGNFIPMGVIF